MREETATTIGFVAAPIVPGLMVGLFTPVTADGPTLSSVLGLLPIGYAVSALISLPFAIPGFFLLKRFNLARWWSIVGGASLIGALASAAIQTPDFSDFPLSARALWIHTVTGVIAGFVFWLIWKQGRR